MGAQTTCIATTGAQKHGFTVHVCLGILADGSKLPAFVILNERSGQLGARVKEALKLPENVHVTATTGGWMMGEKVHQRL